MQLDSLCFTGAITRAIEEKTYKNKDGKESKFYVFSINDRRQYAGYINVRTFTKPHEKMYEHLKHEGAIVDVTAEQVQFWVPKDENGNVKRYQKGDNKDEVIINASVTTSPFRIRFGITGENKTTQNTTQTQQTQAPSGGDTVRGGNDSAPAQETAPQQTQQTQQSNQPVEASAGGASGDPWGF